MKKKNIICWDYSTEVELRDHPSIRITKLSMVKYFLKNHSLRGVHPEFFVKLDFEIAVKQQIRARDRTFEEVPDSGCPRDSHAHSWSIFSPILPDHLNMLKTMLWGALLVTTNLLNTCIYFYSILSKLDEKWVSYEKNVHIWA